MEPTKRAGTPVASSAVTPVALSSSTGSLETHDGRPAASKPDVATRKDQDEEAWRSLAAVFKSQQFSVTGYLKEALPQDLQLQHIETELAQRNAALSSVNAVLHSRVMSNYDAFGMTYSLPG
jgi:hypothetical protein